MECHFCDYMMLYKALCYKESRTNDSVSVIGFEETNIHVA